MRISRPRLRSHVLKVTFCNTYQFDELVHYQSYKDVCDIFRTVFRPSLNQGVEVIFEQMQMQPILSVIVICCCSSQTNIIHLKSHKQKNIGYNKI